MNATTLLRTGRAIATNQLAGAFPRLYVRLARQTGRGGGESSAEETAEYFWRCLIDLSERLGVDLAGLPAFLTGKTILEYGPGSIPGVASLLLAYGARNVVCVDRFPLLDNSPFLESVMEHLAQRLGDDQGKALRSLAGRFTARGVPGLLDVRLHPQGLSGLSGECDLAISRAVLEEVNDLGATMHDMARALRAGGIAMHQVDLRSYGLHRDHPLDFLVASPRLWMLMYGNKCVPNRLRLATYRETAAAAGLQEIYFEPGITIAPEEVESIRPRLWSTFRSLPADELGCLTFWWGLRKGDAR